MISSSVWSDSCVALKHFCDLFSRPWPTFALEAVSLTGLGDSVAVLFFLCPKDSPVLFPSVREGSSLHQRHRPIFVFSHFSYFVCFDFGLLKCSSLQYFLFNCCLMLQNLHIGRKTSLGGVHEAQFTHCIAKGLFLLFIFFFLQTFSAVTECTCLI